MVTAGWRSPPALYGFVTTPAVVGVIDAVVAGVIAFVALDAFGLNVQSAAVLAVAVAILWNVGLGIYQAHALRRDFAKHPGVVSPTPGNQTP